MPTQIDDFYYVVNGQKTYSKNQALAMANNDVRQIHFYEQDAVWDQVDFSVEPADSFQSLCYQRCDQLRQQHDWVCLWLSAGYDSNTAFWSFVESGNRIDEIAYMDRTEYFADPEVPFIEQLVQYYKTYHNPNLTVTRVKLGLDYHREYYYCNRHEWLYQSPTMRLTKTTANLVHRYHSDFLLHKEHTRGSRADIYGKEKPRLNLRDNNWYYQANDLSWDTISAPVHYFYHSGDLPQLHVKQCHMAVRFFESLSMLDEDLVHRIQSNDTMYYESWSRGVGRRAVSCPVSASGTHKTFFTQQFDSPDGRKLREYYAQHDTSFMGRISDDRSTLHTVFSRPILGKEWYIGPLRKSS